MSDKPIELTLRFTTAEQAHHVLEAYHEAMGFNQNTGTAETGHMQDAAQPPVPPYSPQVDDDEEETVDVELDERGVPYHPDYHSGSKKISKGAWNRKKGHDRAAADAYEAGYLQATNVHAPHAQAMPSVNAPTATILPLKDFQDLWVHCCHNHKVNMADQQHIEQTWGGHPMSAVFEDGLKRSQAYAFLQQKANA